MIRVSNLSTKSGALQALVTALVTSSCFLGSNSRQSKAKSTTSQADSPSFGCASVIQALGDNVQAVTCFLSTDLTTQNPQTTPPDNSIPGLPRGAFAPRTDAHALVATPTPITHAVPGLQLAGSMADDIQARWVLRLPAEGWTGRLIVGVPSAVRSEYNGDIFISDYVLGRADAYISTNKGHYASYVTTPNDPLGCRASPPGTPSQGGGASNTFIHFYLLDPGHSFKGWFQRTKEVGVLGKVATKTAYGHKPDHTYLFGYSVGGMTTRHILAEDPGHHEFDGGVDAAGVYWSSSQRGDNVLVDFPAGVRNYLDYRQQGYSARSPAYAAMLEAGFPPDFFAQPPSTPKSPSIGSYWETEANQFWNLLGCLLIKRVDPNYVGETPSYNYRKRLATTPDLWSNIEDIATSSKIERPLITVQGTLDVLGPLRTHGRLFRDDVVAAHRGDLHRLYEIQNGSHVDPFRLPPFNFKQLQDVMPHAQRALDLLKDWIENDNQPPQGQCVPRGGQIVQNPTQPEHCARLLVP